MWPSEYILFVVISFTRFILAAGASICSSPVRLLSLPRSGMRCRPQFAVMSRVRLSMVASDGLLFYRRLFAEGAPYRADHGIAIVEVGHRQAGNVTVPVDAVAAVGVDRDYQGLRRH